MRKENILNKDGEKMKTKEGKELVEYKLEPGDEFIPCFNSVNERTNDVTIKGKEQRITNYSIKALARDKDGKQIMHDGEKEIFISLTPTQAAGLTKRKNDGIELNQTLFVAYEYESEKYGPGKIGIGVKGKMKPMKTFMDFDSDDEIRETKVPA